MGRRLIDLDAELDAVLAELAHAGECGYPDDMVDRILARIDEIEDKQRRQGMYLARKANENDAVAALVAAGADEIDARATVTGKSVESLRKADFIAAMRSDGHAGAGFDALLAIAHKAEVLRQHSKAMDDCIGYMVRPNASNAKDVTGYRFWFTTVADVNANASDELIEWFERHGRLTKAAMREAILTGRSVYTATIGR